MTGLAPKGRPLNISSTIRKAVLGMSTATYTPVNYWLGIPILELCAWLGDYSDMMKKNKESAV